MRTAIRRDGSHDTPRVHDYREASPPGITMKNYRESNVNRRNQKSQIISILQCASVRAQITNEVNQRAELRANCFLRTSSMDNISQVTFSFTLIPYHNFNTHSYRQFSVAIFLTSTYNIKSTKLLICCNIFDSAQSSNLIPHPFSQFYDPILRRSPHLTWNICDIQLLGHI